MLDRVLKADPSIPVIPSITNLLRSIAAEYGILPDQPDYFDALVTSFRPGGDWSPSAKVISFLDNCVTRIARQPVHYEDLAAEARRRSTGGCLLPFCIAEQWLYVTELEDLDHQ